MTTPLNPSAAKAPLRAYQVRAPRISDAIGLALRNAYAGEQALPDEMAALLRTLDRLDGITAH